MDPRVKPEDDDRERPAGQHPLWPAGSPRRRRTGPSLPALSASPYRL